MNTVSINEIERDPSAYLARARAGEVLLITDNDEPVAELKGLGEAAQRTLDFDPVEQFLRSRIANAILPPPWQEEGIAEPTVECRESSLKIARDLFSEYQLIPYRVAASKLGGIFLGYNRSDGLRTLGVEVDNDLDAVGVVANDTEVLASSVFEGEETPRLLAIFRG